MAKRKSTATTKKPTPLSAANCSARECNVTALVSRFSRAAALSKENHVPLWPFCDHRPYADDPRGSLFTLEQGWSLLGWCKAPFSSSRGYNDALVMEYDAKAADPRENSSRESGTYWIHCRLEAMNFRQNEGWRDYDSSSDWSSYYDVSRARRVAEGKE